MEPTKEAWDLWTEVPELRRSTQVADMVAVQEAQFSAKTTVCIQGFQISSQQKRAQRCKSADAETSKVGDVAMYVHCGLLFIP